MDNSVIAEQFINKLKSVNFFIRSELWFRLLTYYETGILQYYLLSINLIKKVWITKK